MCLENFKCVADCAIYHEIQIVPWQFLNSQDTYEILATHGKFCLQEFPMCSENFPCVARISYVFREFYNFFIDNSKIALVVRNRISDGIVNKILVWLRWLIRYRVIVSTYLRELWGLSKQVWHLWILKPWRKIFRQLWLST